MRSQQQRTGTSSGPRRSSSSQANPQATRQSNQGAGDSSSGGSGSSNGTKESEGGGGGGGSGSRTRSNNGGSRNRNGSSMVKDKKWILLNVGGTYFLTSRQTLTRLTSINSPLFRLSINTTNVLYDRDDRGAYLIDRDPAYFAVLLNWLRHGHLFLTRDVTEEGLLLEAEYFNIPELQREIKRRISNRALGCAIGQQRQQSSDFLHHHHQQQSLSGGGSSGQPFSLLANQISNHLGNTSSALSIMGGNGGAGTIGTFNSFGLGPLSSGGDANGGGGGGSLAGLLEV